MLYSSGPVWTIVGKCSGSAAATVWYQLTAGKAGQAAANVLTAQWWLEERQLIVVDLVVKMAAVCQSVGSSSQTEDSQRS